MSKMEESQYRFSLVIPVFNRPQEVKELLESITVQDYQDFEVIIVEDGSTARCEDIVNRFIADLDLKYYYKDNSGPGLSRNYGSEKADGDYIIFLDSDCILPQTYLSNVHAALCADFVDAFGGPDKADDSFTDVQKAISFSMTSFFTTGGIRGGGERLSKFHPRSFNMGYSKKVFQTTGGFSAMRFGEDIDMSIRILAYGFTIRLIKEAYVYHKRRTRFRQFFKQVYNSGIARINLYKRHPKSLKMVHFFPSCFVLGHLFCLCFSFIFSLLFLIPVLLFPLLIFVTAWIQTKKIKVALLAVVASYIQLTAYGIGFLSACWNRVLFSKKEYAVFEKNFYQ